MIRFGSSLILIEKNWSDFKSIVLLKGLRVQYEIDVDIYQVFAVDGQITYSTVIYIGNIPRGYEVDQVTNDANKSDFEGHFQSSINAPTVLTVNQGTRGSDAWPVSGVMVLSIAPTVIQGNSTGAPWIVSGTISLPSGASTSANQSIIIDKLTQEISSGIRILTPATVIQGNSTGAPWIVSGTLALASGALNIGTVNQGVGGSQPWMVSGIIAIDNSSDSSSHASFTTLFDKIVPAANKYMATLFNTSSTRKVVVENIWRYNWQVNSVAGVVLEQELRRVSARTAGSVIVPSSWDTNDNLSSGITADTGSTAVTDSTLLSKLISTNEEVGTAGGSASDIIPNSPAFSNSAMIYNKKPGMRGIILRQNQGITIKNITSSTVGSVSYVIDFTDQPV